MKGVKGVDYEGLVREPSNQRKVVTFPDDSHGENSDEGENDINIHRRKISQLELKLAERTSQHNQEICKWREEVTRLQSSFERHELSRQKLEYELTLSRQDTSKEKRKMAENIEKTNSYIAGLQDEIKNLNIKLQSADHLLSNQKQTSKSELFSVSEANKLLEEMNMELKKENEIIYEEKLATENIVMSWKRKYQESQDEHEELQDKCEGLQRQRDDHTETIRKLMNDVEFSANKEEELITNIQDLRKKIKNVEENVEAERAAHLETKFNTEVIQLKVRDSDNVLEMERARLHECRNNLQKMDAKYRDLEKVCCTERDRYKQLELRFEKCQQEMTVQNKEINAKNKHLDGISNEVKNYSVHLKELMTELEETKEKLSEVEATKSTVNKELKFLLNNYKLIAEVATSPVKKDGWKFSDHIEEVRRILEGYQNKLRQLEVKSSESAEVIVKLTDECATHREIAWSKDRALDEAEQLVKQAQDDAAQHQVKCAAYEERIARYEEEDNQMKLLLSERDERISTLSQKVYRNNLDLDQNYQSALNSLQVICELLLVNDSPVKTKSPSNKLTLEELKGVVMNRIKENHQTNRVMKEKIIMLKEELEKTTTNLKRHEAGLKRLKKLNAQILSQTESSLLEGQQLRNKEKMSYEEEITNLKTKLENTEEKMSSFLNQCNGLSSNDLPSILRKLRQYEDFKLSTTVLINTLTASVWGLLSQHHALMYQKKILLDRVQNLSVLEDGVLEITKTLQDEMSALNEKHFTGLPKSGVFRFRHVVIVVIASNRLRNISRRSCSYVLRHKPSYGHVGLLFYQVENQTNANSKELDIQKWLKVQRSDKILENIQHKICHENMKDTPANIMSFLSLWYSDVIQTAGRDFWHSSVLSLREDNSEKSLVRGLGVRLSELLQCDRYKNKIWASTNNIVRVLRKSILEFTSKLHEGEQLKETLTGDRDRYRDSRNKYRYELDKERSEVAVLKKKESDLNTQITELKSGMCGMVDSQQADEMCAELKNALKREEDLGVLFEKQLDQIKGMEKRLARHEQGFDLKNEELMETMEILRTAQTDLVCRDEIMKDMQGQIVTLKRDKSYLQKSVENQEGKLRTFTCDRELLARCMRHTSSVIHDTKKQMNHSVEAIDIALKELSQNSFVVGATKDNPEMQLLQNTIVVFFDAQREALLRISVLMTEKYELEKQTNVLEEELSAHQIHIRTLRERVAQLFAQDMDTQQRDMFVTDALNKHQNVSKDTVFVPLHQY